MNLHYLSITYNLEKAGSYPIAESQWKGLESDNLEGHTSDSVHSLTLVDKFVFVQCTGMGIGVWMCVYILWIGY